MSEYSLGTAELGTQLSLEGLQSGMRTAKSEAESGFAQVGNVIGGALKVGLAAAGGAMVAAMGAIVKGVASNAEFEQFETRFSVLLGSTEAAKDRMAELAEFGAKTPFELPGVVKADTVLQGFGLHSEEAAKKFGHSGEEIRTIAGDVASGTGASFEEMALLIGKFSSGATGEAISRMMELGITSREELSKLGLEFSKSGELLSPLPQAMDTVLDLMQSKYGGLMEAQSSTFNGMLSNLQDWFNGTLRTISAPIFDVVKEKLGDLLTFLSDPATQAGIAAFADNLAAGVGVVIDWLSANLPPAIEGAKTVIAGLGTVWDAVVSGATSAQQALTTFGQTEWGQSIQRGAQVVVDYFSGPFASEVSNGVAVVQQQFTALGGDQWWAQVQRGAQVAGAYFANDFPGELQRGVAVAQQGLSTFVAGVGAWASQVSAGYQVAATGWNTWVVDLQRGAGVVTSTIGTVAAGVSAWASQVAAGWAVAQAGWNTWVGEVQRGAGVVTGAVNTLIADFQRGVGAVTQAVSQMASAITGGFSNAIASASSIGSNIVNGIISGIRSGAGALADAAAQAASDALEAAKSALGISSPSTEADEQVGVPFIQGIIQGIEATWPMLGEMARNLSKQLVDDMAAVGAAAAEALSMAFTAGLESTAAIARQGASNLKAVLGLDEGEASIKRLTKEKENLQSKLAALDKQAAKDQADRAKQTAKDQADQAKKQGAIQAELAKLASEKAAKIAEVQATTDFDENKAKRIADITAQYAEKEADQQQKLNDLLTSAAEKEKERAASAAEKDKDRATQRADLQKDIDTNAAALAAAERYAYEMSTVMADTQRQLDTALTESQKITDPKLAADYYKQRSQQILELARLNQEYRQADTQAEREAIGTQIQLITQAQTAERQLFAATATQQSTQLDKVSEGLQTLLSKLKDEAVRDLAISKLDLSDRDREKMLSQYQQDLAAQAQIERLLAQTSNPLGSLGGVLGSSIPVPPGGNTITIDARGAADPKAVEDAVRRALLAAGQAADIRTRTRG